MFQGIQISLDQVIKKKLYRGVAVGVVSLFVYLITCNFVSVVISNASLLFIFVYLITCILYRLSSLMHLSSSHSFVKDARNFNHRKPGMSWRPTTVHWLQVPNRTTLPIVDKCGAHPSHRYLS